ncbi:MAG TPA: DUF4267 domain-containing protein [Polyangiales bacterium]|nr:DUF4267 domain-containing protein [Polyangiales bacterium]
MEPAMKDRLRVVTTAGVALALTVLVLLAVRGIVDPRAAALAFGVAAGDDSAAFYQAVYRSRNLVLALTGFAFLFSSMWRALAILLTASVALPVYDIVALALVDAPISLVHPITLGVLLTLASLLWLRVRETPREAP